MKKHENRVLLLLVVALVAFPLIWKTGADFGGYWIGYQRGRRPTRAA